MTPLAEVQRQVRQAVVTGDTTAVAPLLAGTGDLHARMRIHHRHYQASLVEAMLGKFPATMWLVGGPFMAEAVDRFLAEHPPRVLCIAEYGEAFPAFLGDSPAAATLPYLRSFAELEWLVGQVSLAVDGGEIDAGALSTTSGAALSSARAILQAGVRYLDARWPVDTLMQIFLTDTAPDRLSLDPEPVWLEVRGARAQFTIRRLDQGTFWFRQALRTGCSFVEAAEMAMDADKNFAPGRAFGQLVAEGLLAGITSTTQKESL